MAQMRIARTWDDVPRAVREKVRAEADGDLRRVELIDSPDGGFSVHVHPAPIELDAQATADALAAAGQPGDDIAEILARTSPVKLYPVAEPERE